MRLTAPSNAQASTSVISLTTTDRMTAMETFVAVAPLFFHDSIRAPAH